MSCELYSEDRINNGNIYCGYCNNDGELVEACACGYVKNIIFEE